MSSVSLARQSRSVTSSSGGGKSHSHRTSKSAANDAGIGTAWVIDACANTFPPMLPEEFESLKVSIARNGLRDPVLIWNGRLMDGRHRLKACQALGIAPKVIELVGSYEEARSAAFASNINRRHLRTGQRALLAAPLASRKPGQTKAAKATEPLLTQEDAAKLFAISRDAVQRACHLLAHADAALLDKVRDGAMSLHEAMVTLKTGKAGLVAQTSVEERSALRVAAAVKERLGSACRAQRLHRQAAISTKNQALPMGARYSVLLADPPWDYGMPNDRAPSRVIPHEHYPTMPMDAICGLDVAGMAADDAMLFLWCPASLLPEGLKVMQAWGFAYSSNWIWHKTGGKLNCGGGTAVIHHEHLLVGKRGKGLTIYGTKARQPSVFGEDVERHSAKPKVAHERIEALYPKVNKVELFGRAARTGWQVWGNQSA